MPKENYRLVVLSEKAAQVFNGNVCVAEFEITGVISKVDVEEIRIAEYKEPVNAS
jgi:hypothetical protein